MKHVSKTSNSSDARYVGLASSAQQESGILRLVTMSWPSAAISSIAIVCTLLASCSRTQAQREPEPTADVRVDLNALGLPKDFFSGREGLARTIIGYRFVVWLDRDDVVVGFNTSPSSRVAPDRIVEGSARLLIFSVGGILKAKRDVPYLADGNGELVAEGEAIPGPGGTLLFRIDSVNLDKEGRKESPSGVLLFDVKLHDIARFDRFLEQTTFVNHALVFQEGFTLGRSRNYDLLDGSPPAQIRQWKRDWPIDARDRKFGEHGLAYITCQQELRPNEYVSTGIVYAGARQRCTMNAEGEDGTTWQVRLRDGDTAQILGILADGSVAGEVSVKESKAGQLVIWKKDQTTELLPWIPKDYCGTVQSATADMSRYAVFATCDDRSDDGRWMVFDRKSQRPLVNRQFPKNGRAALSPDGSKYASFESGELRIYSLPKPD
ncbi:MAG: hypothetical protein JWO19_517 [Bryobacterales bacterium]|jgi:hypothetical protein|nr:hypothetical protein [Bryobacterales bacterium]